MSYHILAMDMAGSTGWARWRQGVEQPVWGTAKLSKRPYGLGLSSLKNFLLGKIVGEGITHIIVESVFVARDHVSAAQRLYALQGVVYMIGYERNIEVREVAPGEWRSPFLGVTQAPKTVPKEARRRWIKDKARDECERRGWVVNNDDESDALGLLVYGRSMIDPAWAAQDAPLFRETA